MDEKTIELNTPASAELEKVETTLAAHATVPARVKDRFGLTVQSTSGSVKHYESGELVQLDRDQAMKLFKEGRVSLEEFRPPGAPLHVERR